MWGVSASRALVSISARAQLYTQACSVSTFNRRTTMTSWRPPGDKLCCLTLKSSPVCVFISYTQPQLDTSAAKFLTSPTFRSWVYADRHFWSPLTGAGWCPCPDQSWAAWCWPSWNAAAAYHCQCSAGGFWRLSTFPRPCRSRCKGSWRSWVRPREAASVLI